MPRQFAGIDTDGSITSYSFPISLGSERLLLCRELLNQYLFDVTTTYEVSQGDITNVFRGDSNQPSVLGWRAYNINGIGASKGASQIARDLGLSEGQRIYSWDVARQAWVAHPTLGDNRTLAEGTAVMFNSGVFDEFNLENAGLGRVDENSTLVLRQGWNLMSPELGDLDGDGFIDIDDSSQAASLFDRSLIDCNNNLGVAAVVVYDLLTQEFSIYLPCFSNVSVPGYSELDEISRYDSVYVFFQGQLPVSITWDTDTETYVPVA